MNIVLLRIILKRGMFDVPLDLYTAKAIYNKWLADGYQANEKIQGLDANNNQWAISNNEIAGMNLITAQQDQQKSIVQAGAFPGLRKNLSGN